MDFSFPIVSADCSLRNPTVVATLALCALGFGGWTVRVFASRRSGRRKAAYLAGVVVVSLPAFHLLRRLAVILDVYWHLPGDSLPAVSCVESPPLLAGPAATILAAVLIHAALALWRSQRRKPGGAGEGGSDGEVE